MASPPEQLLSASYALEYTYTRSVGPVIGRFLTGLRERRIEGIVGSDGKVIVPQGPGLGVEVDRERVGKYTREEWG